MKRLFSALVMLFAAGLVFADGQQAAPPDDRPGGWPGWRGPGGNGTSRETGWNPRALEGGAKVLWTAMVGTGYSNVAIGDGRVYVTGSIENRFALTCLDAVNGSIVWQTVFEDLSADPQSTPALDGNRVYGLSKFGGLVCLNTADGSLAWRKRMPPLPYPYMWATSPVVDGNLLLFNANHAGIAFDKTTGDVVWDSGTSSKDSPVADARNDWNKSTYASPVLLTLQGRRAALFMGPTALSAVDTSTGKVLWSRAHHGVEVTVDPVVSGSTVFMPNAVPTLFEVGGGDPRVVWTSTEFSCQVSTPAALNGCLFVLDWNTIIDGYNWGAVKDREWPLRCVDLKTGQVLWTKPVPFVQLTVADGRLLMLDLKGTLTVADASSQGLITITSADVLAGADRPRTFPTPSVLFEGRVFCRNYAGDLVCVDMT